MSDNKFIKRLKGEQTPKSVVEVQNDKLVTPFTNVPNSTDVVGAIIDDKDSSVIVAKGAQNWKLDGSSLVVASSLSGDGTDYTGEFNASGNGLWINATYSLPATIFNSGTKWVLKLCGKNLLTTSGETIGLTMVVKIGTTHITTKTFTVAEGANVFCRQLVIDFSESEQAVIKAQAGTTMTLQLLCADANASATIYNGMTVLTALQRRVDSDAVASNTSTFDDLETRLDNIETELGDTFVKTDGTSIMTAPLKFAAGSMRGAVGPYLNGVSFWKMNAQYSITNIANLTDSQFLPVTTNSIDIGRSANTWKDLYLGGKAYVATINNGADISVPTYTGTMVVADSTGATAGQLLLLDSNLKPVWGETSTYLTYQAGWTTTGTTKAFCDDIAADSTATVGKAYLGEVTLNDLPAGIVNAEIIVEIMDGTTASDKVIKLTLSSGNVAPYMWIYTYWNGGNNTSGWQPLGGDSLPDQTGHNGEFLITNGSTASWSSVPTPTINYSINGGNYTAGSGSYAITRFSLMLQKDDGTWEKPTDTSANYSQATNKTVNTNGFLLNQILYYNYTGLVSGGQLTGLNRVYSKHASVPMSYSTNCGTTPGWALGTWIYLVGTLGVDGLFYLDTTQWWSDALPNSADGKLYIRLGPVSSSTSDTVALLEDRPIFYHDGIGIKEYYPNDALDYIIEKQNPNAGNGYTWYRKYKSGWVEQGGLTTGTGSSTYRTVTLPVTMADTNYSLYATPKEPTALALTSVYYGNKSTNQILLMASYNGGGTSPTGYGSGEISWEVKGVAA